MKKIIFYIVIIIGTLFNVSCNKVRETNIADEKQKDPYFIGEHSKDEMGLWDSGILAYSNNLSDNPIQSLKDTEWQITYLKATGFNLPTNTTIIIKINSDNHYGLNATYSETTPSGVIIQPVRMWSENILGNVGQSQLHLEYFPILSGSQFYTAKIQSNFIGSSPHTNAIFQLKIHPYSQSGVSYTISMDRIK